jgi:phospholipase/lecithinase/hemolysin
MTSRKFMSSGIRAALPALLLASSPLWAQANYSGVVAFGDSLSDAGNNGLWTNNASQSGYGFGGTWVMQLAQRLGYTLTASNAGGTDYAYAGSGTFSSGPYYSSSYPGTATQISSYLSTVGGKASPTVLYAIDSGPNDVFAAYDYYTGMNSSKATLDAGLTAQGQQIADNIKGQIITLINAGAKTIIWPNMAPLQYVPNWLGNPDLGFAVNGYNSEHDIDLAALRAAYPTVNIVTVNVDAQSFLVGPNAPAFGILNSTQAWKSAPASVPYSANSSNPNADRFGSWDGLHPTTYVHYLIASNAYENLIGGLPDGTYQISNQNSGLVLDTVGEAGADGVDVDQATGTGAVSQRWVLISEGTNEYIVTNGASGRALDVYDASTASGAAVDIYDSNGNNNQKWIITKNSSGQYTIQGLQSGNYLTVAGASTSSGALTNVSTGTGATSQQWVITPEPISAQIPISGVFAFGDDLSDAGNNGYHTNTASQSGYGLGGLWVQQLATKLGYSLTASNSGGADYAVSGSGTFSSGSLSSTTNSAAQISSYLSGAGGSASQTALYTILSGANDIINTVNSSNSGNVASVATQAADNISAQITTLINAGAKRIMWVNMSALQLDPDYSGNSLIASGVSAFNAEYATDLAALQAANPGVFLMSVNANTQSTLLNSFAGAYGIWNTTQAWTTAPSTVAYSEHSSNPNSDYFASWDGFNPTTYVDFYTASNAYQSLIGGLPDGTYQIVNVNSNLNLDTVGEGTANGVDADQSSFTDAPSQQWNLVCIGTNEYLVLNVKSGTMLDVAGGSTASGAAVDIYYSTGGTNQKWIIAPTASGSYTIQGVQSGNLLTVAGASTSAGALVNVSTGTGASSQQWLVEAP